MAIDHPHRSSAVADPSDSDVESFLEEEEEDEYEEIEVEEEEEEEEVEEEEEEEEEVEEEEEEYEEIEVDEEEDEDEEEKSQEEEEFGEDLSPINQNQQEDTQVMESEGHEEKSVTNLPPDTQAVEGSRGNSKTSDPIDAKQEEESRVNDQDSEYPAIGKRPIAFQDYKLQDSADNKKDSVALIEKRTSKDHSDSNVPLCDSRVMNADATNTFSSSGKQVTTAVVLREGFDEEVGVLYSKEESKTTKVQSGDDMKQGEPRLDVQRTRPRSLSPGTELKDGNKRPAVICDFYAKGWCIKGNSCRFLHVRDQVDIDSQQHCGAVASSNLKNELLSDEGLRDSTERGESLRQSRYLDDYRKYASPSNHVSTWARSSSSFSSSPWNSDPLIAQKRLDGDREYNASPFSGFESENFSRTILSGNPLGPAGYKVKNSSNDWEPSVPFRPSFAITKTLLSLETQYDPIRDSIEPPKLGDGFSRFLSSSQGTSIVSTHLQKNVNPVLPETFGTEYSSDKHYGKDLFTSETKAVGAAVPELQNINTTAKEEKLSSDSHVRDISKANKTSIDFDSALQSERIRHKTESKVDRARQNDEMDLDLKTDGIVHKESKALKHFRVALIEFVKELVKPAWRDGLLSKDAHKMVVKKAVDKVLSTLPPQQIPCTAESVKLYLSSSQPKISKLVEGYVEKYGKS